MIDEIIVREEQQPSTTLQNQTETILNQNKVLLIILIQILFPRMK